MKTLRVGRNEDADIVIPDDFVSRNHADIIVSANGKYYLIDRRSTNGCYRWRGDKWERFTKEFFDSSDKIQFGRHETTISRLLSQVGKVQQVEPPAKNREGRGRVERDSNGIPVVR